MNSTIEQIKSIINPVRVLKVDDWKKIAKILTPTVRGMKVNVDPYTTVSIMERYESLTSQPLVKEMFVCEVKQPDLTDVRFHPHLTGDYSVTGSTILKETDEYQAAQKKLWFEGFENKDGYYGRNSGVDVGVTSEGLFMYIYSTFLLKPTAFDFIIEISRYNRTASNPIQINFSDNFIQELIK